MMDQTPLVYTISPVIRPLLHLTAAAASTAGRRQHNEDTVLCHVSQTLKGEPFGLFIVCDGMGGHQAGDIASRMAVSTVCLELAPVLAAATDSQTDALNNSFQRAVTTANSKIWHYAQNQDEPGFRMGTTITLAFVVGQRLHVTNVGDSRAYLWREGRLKQITRDHSLVADLAEQLPITPTDMVTHPYRHILTRALGRRERVQADQFVDRLYPGDRLLLCTDGVWKFVEQQELAQQLAQQLTPEEQCQGLVAAAAQHGSSDDISAIVIHCDNHFQQIPLPALPTSTFQPSHTNH
jgi:protein phosphatase